MRTEGPGSTRVIVLGGGLSGLLAAWWLRRPGRTIEVWEASSTAGGWARTLAWPGPGHEPGFLERGPQGLRMGRSGPLNDLLRELELGLLDPGARGPRWLGRNGRRHPSPSRIQGLLFAPGPTLPERLRLLAEPFVPTVPDTTENLHAYFERRLGAGFAREFLPALVGGVFAAPPERIGLESLPRLRELERKGGLLIGGLRMGREHTRIPCLGAKAGVGSLAEALANRLGCVLTNRGVQSLQPLPGGRWRIASDAASREADAVVMALPPQEAARCIAPFAGEAASILQQLQSLDLHVWHSRHAMVPGWERGLGLLIHPPEGRGLLGVVAMASDDPRGVPGLLQVRAYLGGAYPIAPDLESWPGVLRELRRWLPELPEPVQVRHEACPAAFPLLGVGHTRDMDLLQARLPANLHWIGSARFGPGVAHLIDRIRAWAGSEFDSR